MNMLCEDKKVINRELKDIVDREVSNYKSDLDLDFKDIKEDFKLRGNNSKNYIFFTRQSGTVLMREEFITVLNSNENIDFKYWVDSAINCYRINVTKACPVNIYGTVEKINLDKYKKTVYNNEKKPKAVLVRVETKAGKIIKNEYVYSNNCYRDILSIERLSSDDILAFNYLNYSV